MQAAAGVAGIIPNGETILILQRSQDDHFSPGAYGLPGGGLEPDETPEEGIIREVFEETGLRTEVVRLLGLRNYPKSDFGGTAKAMAVYLLKVTGPIEIHLSKEHDAFRWVSDLDLGRIFAPDDFMRRVIHQYFESNVKSK